MVKSSRPTPRLAIIRALRQDEPKTVAEWSVQRLASFVDDQLRYWGAQSVISGSKRRLRLRRYWSDRPLSECNCVVVTTGEARRLSRAGRRRVAFPPQLAHLMNQMRATDEQIDVWLN
jgi:hypothetical protein